MSNTGITLVDVRQEAMDAIRKLKSGDIDVKTAGAIKDLLNTVVDTAKTQVAYIQSIPNTIKEQMSVNEVKAIAGTLVDRDAELDNSLAEIRQNQKQVNWEYITVGKDPARAELICKNLQRWGFETFILKHKTVTSPLRCYVYVRKDYGKNNGNSRYK